VALFAGGEQAVTNSKDRRAVGHGAFVAATTALAITLGSTPASSVRAQTDDGAAVFQRACAECHVDPAPETRAPDLDGLRRFAPEAVLTALMSGRMFRQGSELSESDRIAVAGFAAGRPVGSAVALPDTGRCENRPEPLLRSDLRRGWNGWGGAIDNHRFRSEADGGLDAADLPRLKLKWAFAFPGVNSVRAQPVVVGGRVFIGSEAGDVFALDAQTGCTFWSYHAQAGIRAAVSVGPYPKAGGETGYAIYFADQRAFAYAVDADTGREIWRTHVDDHLYATSTGSPTLYDGRLYVVTSGVGEEGQGGRPGYGCCTFRGSVTALDANTGNVIWKTYSLPEPQRRGTSTEGEPLYGPAGGGIWAAPTVDVARGRLYVSTGNAYAGPAGSTTDAVLALDLANGSLIWSFQPTANDVFAGGCGRQGGNPNCPDETGPDLDFSMPAILIPRDPGEDILVLGQKSGMVWGIDPDDGTEVWRYRASAGGGLGGQWGMAADGERAYLGVNGTSARPPGGVRAVAVDSGAEVWAIPAAEPLCGTERGCSQAQGAAVTAIPGAVIAGSMDGGIRAHAAATGELLWEYDTNRNFETVNGVPGNGGAMDGPGAAVADGMLFVDSGYISLIGRPGNVLLAFGPD
jgi:polyvinyl alcohol dehydrogenase (cytochrome)